MLLADPRDIYVSSVDMVLCVEKVMRKTSDWVFFEIFQEIRLGYM